PGARRWPSRSWSRSPASTRSGSSTGPNWARSAAPSSPHLVRDPTRLAASRRRALFLPSPPRGAGSRTGGPRLNADSPALLGRAQSEAVGLRLGLLVRLLPPPLQRSVQDLQLPLARLQHLPLFRPGQTARQAPVPPQVVEPPAQHLVPLAQRLLHLQRL